jgi:hypothetical protein
MVEFGRLIVIIGLVIALSRRDHFSGQSLLPVVGQYARQPEL